MPADHEETRSVAALRTGTKVCLLVAVPILAAALYFLFAPVTVHTSSGGVFNCGTAVSPPTEQFPKNVCQNIGQVNLYRAYALIATGVLVPLLGFLLFGADRHVQTRRRDDDEQAYAERRGGRGERASDVEVASYDRGPRADERGSRAGDRPGRDTVTTSREDAREGRQWDDEDDYEPATPANRPKAPRADAGRSRRRSFDED